MGELPNIPGKLKGAVEAFFNRWLQSKADREKPFPLLKKLFEEFPFTSVILQCWRLRDGSFADAMRALQRETGVGDGVAALAAYTLLLELEVDVLQSRLRGIPFPELPDRVCRLAPIPAEFLPKAKWSRRLSAKESKKRKKESKAEYDLRRVRRSGAGQIEREIMAPKFSYFDPSPPRIPCIENLLAGGSVKMEGDGTTLASLFGRNRKSLPPIPSELRIRVGRETFYDFRTFVFVTQNLLAADTWMRTHRVEFLRALLSQSSRVPRSPEVDKAVLDLVEVALSRIRESRTRR